MSILAVKFADLSDLLALGPESRCELIDGQILNKSAGSGKHGDIVSAFDTQVRSRFRRPKGPKGQMERLDGGFSRMCMSFILRQEMFSHMTL